MDPRIGCEYCKLVYGMEEPRTETVFTTRHFLAFWDDETKRKILVIDKDHGWTPVLNYSPQDEKGQDFQKAVNQAIKILREKYPDKLISTYWYNVNKPKKDHFSLMAQAVDVPPNYGW